MKRLGLSSALLAATLFVATGLRAEPPKDAALAAVPAPSAAVATDLTTADAMKSAGADDIFQHFDQLESAHAATQPAAAPSNPARPLAGLVPGTEPFRLKMLEMFDKNNDGRLDDNERAEARKYAETHGPGEAGPAAREQMMKRFDKNGDGKLDPAETAELRKFMQAQRPAAKPANAGGKPAKLEQVAADLAKRRADSLERSKKAPATDLPAPEKPQMEK